ncbi:hypothetical protein EWU20_00295 [Aquirufa antheringensis]|jgi:hypothetical protein|uniref:Uncharacterized protein n=1 Tax=Aquirufa antheringensis TaxID=2516559 RepID=A0A4Q9BG21_9BACT|nr:hypothetical protein [Aquirufa antheringensis]TBH75044.1 hypothetical protein EWU20_00295 [Aquirufa antheringensis]
MEKIKHLEFIQNIISRHNNNSFMMKGWTITIFTALLALGGALNNIIFSLISLLPIVLFWYLDAFYLSNERCFVELFNSVVKGEYLLPNKRSFKKTFVPDNENCKIEKIVDFDMNFIRFKKWNENTIFATFKSTTILWFYLPLCLIAILITIFHIRIEKQHKPLPGYSIEINSYNYQ